VLFKRLILQRAFLDGMPGLLAAMSSAAYAYMKYAFLWELNTRGGKEKNRNTSSGSTDLIRGSAPDPAGGNGFPQTPSIV
jgi:hypothetical protein